MGQFSAVFDSRINLVGSSFLLNGVPISGLQIGVASTITQRNRTLSGTLADGSPFSFDLNTAAPGTTGNDYFSPDAFLTVTLARPGDFDGDGDVDGRDFLRWQRGQSPSQLGADSLADWQDHYGTSLELAAFSVPEPETVLLIVACIGTVLAVGSLSRR